jgi:hypothetical protein
MNFGSIEPRTDGFGAHFQHYMWAAYYFDANNKTFVMPNVNMIEHNYGKKASWVDDLVRFMRLNEVFESRDSVNPADVEIATPMAYCRYVEADVDAFLESSVMDKIRSRFFEANDHLLDKYFIRKAEMRNAINIAVHVRRNNQGDCRLVDPTSTAFDIFKREIDNLLSEIPSDKNVRLHIISQASFPDIREAFFGYLKSGKNGRKVTVAIHHNEEVVGPFLTMATADYLITSPSSFSYAAALLNRGTVIYYPFWHNPSKKWRVINTPKQNLVGYNC